MNTRIARTVITAAAVALTFAPSAHAATIRDSIPKVASCPALMRTGSYRIEIKRSSEEPTSAILLLERAAGCQSALLVTQAGTATLEIKSISENELVAVVKTGRKSGTMTLRFSDESVSGRVEIAKKSWDVSGLRTS
jgi:hypothetical protein